MKTDYQGLPQPLLIELHPESDFTDLTYLVRQVFHFSYLSWRSFFPAIEPVNDPVLAAHRECCRQPTTQCLAGKAKR